MHAFINLSIMIIYDEYFVEFGSLGSFLFLYYS